MPGHEIAGVIDALGDGVPDWKVGQRVGVGWHGGHCGHCDSCRRGDFVTCRERPDPGHHLRRRLRRVHGRAGRGAGARSPTSWRPWRPAPLLCAGITTYNALRNSGARAGDLVAILGIGGLGHLGVQFAARMGFRTVAIARGADKAALARKLGAHHYIDSTGPGRRRAELTELGGARVVLATVTNAKAMSAVVGGLGVDGKLIVVGAAPEPIEVSPFAAHRQRAVDPGLAVGNVASTRRTRWPSARSASVRPMIETIRSSAPRRPMSG